MSSRSAISIRGLGKSYRITHEAERPKTLVEAAVGSLRSHFGRTPQETFWALRDVDLQISEGEVVGLIGRNGAGKSTLLKILSRITRPSEGRVDLHGRVGCLLEVGTGFHRELTGRENIYLNGSILGMRRSEIDRRFDEIVDFAGTERFLDTPVKHYSSGMYVRLAFSVAAHLDPEILLVDEVLSVGDVRFRKKCLEAMEGVARQGRTVILVSHDPTTIESLCQRTIWLENGRVRASGPTPEVLSRYLEEVVDFEGELDLAEHPTRVSSGPPILRRMQILNGRDQPTAAVALGEDLRIRLLLDPDKPLPDPNIGVAVSTRRGQRVFTAHTRFSSSQLEPIREPTWVECCIPSVSLVPGSYVLKLTAGHPTEDLDVIENAASVEILARTLFESGQLPLPTQGVVVQESTWTACEPLAAAVVGDGHSRERSG